MITTKDALLNLLADWGIPQTTVVHPPLHTVSEARAWRRNMTGGHCKNLFLKDKKGALFLIVTLEDRVLRLNRLSRPLGCARLSFAKPALLEEKLGVQPGSVTPFALINDKERSVCPVLDAAMLEFQELNYHPLDNRATTRITREDLLTFIRKCGHTPLILDLETSVSLNAE